MKVERLLSSLRKLKKTGAGEWVACCPAHEDRSPSLAIKETEDGRVLIHCFAGCEPQAILSSIGLTFSDVMPERVGEFKPMRQKFSPRVVAEVTAFNASVIAAIAEEVAHGAELSIEDKDKLVDLAAEIREAVNYALS